MQAMQAHRDIIGCLLVVFFSLSSCWSWKLELWVAGSSPDGERGRVSSWHDVDGSTLDDVNLTSILSPSDGSE